jgi:3-phenylpropionate/cinnamic acid dioxygenase small subunit
MFGTGSRSELQLEVERLIAYEAYLLDERRFHEWLALFTEDATYAVSVREVTQGTEEDRELYRYPEVPVFDEDHSFTTIRVKRLETRLAHAEQPASLTRHLITNVLVHKNDGDDGLLVSSSFQVYQHRPGVSEQVFYGKREDLLRWVDDQWRIARRQVVLDTSLLPSTISIFF